ncbi:hypothetical protein ACN28I_42345 [Archangium gephyra]|uniref:hypothetical protein n=1 Tax=Archangium gephyra TaxID=48 RepID=UPI003B797EB4
MASAPARCLRPIPHTVSPEPSSSRAVVPPTENKSSLDKAPLLRVSCSASACCLFWMSFRLKSSLNRVSWMCTTVPVKTRVPKSSEASTYGRNQLWRGRKRPRLAGSERGLRSNSSSVRGINMRS